MSIGSLHQVGGEGITHPDDPNMFVWIGDRSKGEPCVLFEAGSGRGQDKFCREIGRYGITLADIGYVIVSHCHDDHYRGIAKIKEESDAIFIAPSLGAPIIEAGDDILTEAVYYGEKGLPYKVDATMDDGFRLKVGKTVFRGWHMPGHTPDSFAVEVIQEETRTLLAADSVYASVFLNDGRHPEDVTRQGKESHRSMRLLNHYDALAIGHSMTGLRGEVDERLEEAERMYAPLSVDGLIELQGFGMGFDPYMKLPNQSYNH